MNVQLECKASLQLQITACSRYRLWINGQPVLSGPCRSSVHRYFYDAIEVGEYLQVGENVFAVQVLLCDNSSISDWNTDPRYPIFSVETPPTAHRLAASGTAVDENGNVLADVHTGKAPWKVSLDNTWSLVRNMDAADNLGAVWEQIDFTRTPSQWKLPSFNDTLWSTAISLEPVLPGAEQQYGILKKFPLEARPIPLLNEIPCTLTRELGGPVFGGRESITVEPHRSVRLLLDAEGQCNGYMRYRMDGGTGAKLTFTYFEKFVRGVDEVPRDDWQHGEIGPSQKDSIIAGGGELIYEPFWYRSLRFLQIEIETAEEPLVLFRPEIRKTGYPLPAVSTVRSSAPWVEPVYEMAVRTLRCCMTDAYMDCPFWEQMQYPMDTRLQALFTYACGADTALAKKALQDFHDSTLPMGLVQGHAPSAPKQIISTFSLHYIFMLYEYWQRTGDLDLLQQYRTDVDRILDYYDRHIGPSGLVEDLGYWDFVDWQDAWADNAGCPGATKSGPSTIINLMYGKALLAGSEIWAAAGRPPLSLEYQTRQKAIAERVQALCWDEDKGLYREGPDYPEYTQHAQAWAVLNGLVSGPDAKALMERTMTDPDILRCGYSTCFELFRACEQAGCYHLTQSLMDWWIHMVEEHCSTCPETKADSRSECHGWSAVPIYELIAVSAGFRRADGDPGRIVVRPHMDLLPDLEGTNETEYGTVQYRYQRNGDKLQYEITLPEGLQGTFVGADGTRVPLQPGYNRIDE